MLIILPYLQLAAGHAGCYGLQGRFISKNSLFSYSDDISSRYPGMLKDIPSCIWLLTDLRSKIHQYVPCGIPCNAHLETCGFSPASAGMENATAGSEASRSTEGALSQRIYELRKVPCESSPPSAGSELTAQVCWPVIRLCHFGRRNYTIGHHAAGHGSCCARPLPTASLYYAVKGLGPHFGIISAYVLWLSRYLHLYRSNGGGYRPARQFHPG